MRSLFVIFLHLVLSSFAHLAQRLENIHIQHTFSATVIESLIKYLKIENWIYLMDAANGMNNAILKMTVFVTSYIA